VPTTHSYDRTPVPTARELHVLNRLGCGYSRAELTRLRNAGGPVQWFERQLRPDAIAEDAVALEVDGWFPGLGKSHLAVWADDRSGAKPAWKHARDLANRSLLRRIHSRRTVFENMVEFWSNHLHVSAEHFPGFTHRASYDALIRTHALGRFETLLVEATLHPAMVLYLDNWLSERTHPNENHGRELLELHTVGRAAGYSEAEVKDSARILSGYTVRSGWSSTTTEPWTPYYDTRKHYVGPVSVLGFQHANGDADGREVARAYLVHLARHPATARRIARKLCVRFVADDPSAALVERVAQAYLGSGTDIRATLRALVGSDEFWASAGRKATTPSDDLVSAARVLGIRAQAPTTDADAESCYAHALVWTLSSTLPFQWPRPDGPPDDAVSWGSATRMLNSWRMHWDMAGGWWPRKQVVYRTPASWLPQRSLRFDQLVDHLSRLLLGRRSTAALRDAAAVATGVRLDAVITADHELVRWKMPRLLLLLLDSPAHMTR
jgi:uncharacterized protein (DUF1800 family)